MELAGLGARPGVQALIFRLGQLWPVLLRLGIGIWGLGRSSTESSRQEPWIFAGTLRLAPGDGGLVPAEPVDQITGSRTYCEGLDRFHT